MKYLIFVGMMVSLMAAGFHALEVEQNKPVVVGTYSNYEGDRDIVFFNGKYWVDSQYAGTSGGLTEGEIPQACMINGVIWTGDWNTAIGMMPILCGEQLSTGDDQVASKGSEQ